MLTSLVSANEGTSIDVHFLHDDRLLPRDLANLGAMVKSYGATWSPIAVSEESTARFPHTERYGYSAWYRILLPDLLPDLARVLYLDSDLLILDRMTPLYDTPLEGCYLGAVTQPTPPAEIGRLVRSLGLPDAASYFNSGVMTLDLEALRRAGSVDQVLEFIADGRGPMPWADQDPLNAVLHHRRLHLAPRWNVMTPIFDLPESRLPWTRGEIQEAVASPAVVHFIGPYKPWHYRCRHPYRDAYFAYLASTPWNDKPIEGRTARNMLVKPMPPRWQPRIDTTIDRGVNKAVRAVNRLRPGADVKTRSAGW
ncbi:MAG: glycosyltransferase family 8 protein [Frankiaceae bacterium]|nr:glycosyltransferase family 8 protein [Frankiaceae bacterium]